MSKITVLTNAGKERVEVIEEFEHNGRLVCIHKKVGQLEGYSMTDKRSGYSILTHENIVSVKVLGIELLNRNKDFDYSSYKVINK